MKEEVKNEIKIKNKEINKEDKEENKLNIKTDEKINDDFENSYIFQSKLLDIRNECLKHGFVMGYSLVKISDFSK